MNEQFSNENRIDDHTLSTADLVNRSRSTAVLSESDTPEESSSWTSDREPVNRAPLDSLSVDDRIGGTHYETRNGLPAAEAAETAQPNQLFQNDELTGYRSHWDAVQTSFVDEPRTAVQQADSLVANVVERIAEQFAAERQKLEKQWDRGEDVDTEDLRQAFKRYRAFFDRLLAF